MNYGGSGASKDDPIVIDTLQDLAPLMQKSAGSVLHIAFPETYNGPKVIDLRSAGWNPNGRINIDWTTDGIQTIRRYVYFNGWTILGLSIMGSFFLNLVINGRTNANEKQIYFYDLTIKNAYILGGEGEAWLFRTEASYGCRIYFYRCKFSMMLDSQTASTYAFASTVDEEEFYFLQCSFNIRLNSNNASYSYKTWIMNDFRQYRWLMRNCIMNIRSNNFRAWGTSDNDSLVTCTNMQFSKIVGDIKCTASGSTEVKLLFSKSGCFYNVVDMAYRHYTEEGVVRISFGTGMNIVNKDNFKFSNGNAMADSEITGNNKSVITTEQMLDADYLNSINFIVGDPPSD